MNWVGVRAHTETVLLWNILEGTCPPLGPSELGSTGERAAVRICRWCPLLDDAEGTARKPSEVDMTKKNGNGGV